MVTVTFLASLQEYQEERIADLSARLRADHPEWTVKLLSPGESRPLLTKYKLKFGPAILVNDRIEFVGIPRYRMLVECVAMIATGKISPRTAAPPPAPAPPAAPAAPAKPATTPAPSETSG